MGATLSIKNAEFVFILEIREKEFHLFSKDFDLI